MAKPTEVTSVQVSDGYNLDNPGQPYRVMNVTFYIGQNGPFHLSYKWGEYSAETVNADMQKKVDLLKGIGAL